MLRIHQISSAGAAQQYYGRGGDYYGQELVGDWGGKGAAMLGLRGQVQRTAFDQLCENINPANGGRLTGHTRDERTVGYDFNFNAPKGLSLLYGINRDPQLLDAFRLAVQDTMSDIEEEMRTRVRKHRRNEDRVVGNLISAEFVHFTSRPVGGTVDPALHAHVVVFNAVHDPEEACWKAGAFRETKRDAPYFEALFHNRLASRLAGLGYAVERRGRDWDLGGVSRPLVQKFSRRTQEIETLAEKLGISDPDAKSKLGAKSRAHKCDKLSIIELQQSWQDRLTPKESHALNDVATKRIPMPVPARDAAETAVQQAALHLFERRSVVPYRELLAESLRRGPGAVTLEGVERAARKMGVLVRELDGRELATIPAAYLEERAIIRMAKSTRGMRSRLGVGGRKFVREWLTPGQKAAVTHALTSTDQVILIEGRAGVGKTTLTEEIVDGIEENGRSAVMVAPSAQASRGVLRDAGFADADTLQRLLVDKAMQETAKGNVIIVDEAGLIGMPTMRRLLELAAKLKSRVILIGDRNQHRAVERGSPFEFLAQEAELPVARVDEIRRQKDAYLEAVKLLSDRKIAEGFNRLDKLGWICEASPEAIYQEAAAAYLQAFDECRGDVLAVSPTHAEIDRFTAAIRAQLAAKGSLGETRQFDVWKPAYLTEGERKDTQCYEPGWMVQFHTAAPGFKAGARMIVREGGPIPIASADRFSVYRPAQLSLGVGDRIRLTANGKSLDGHRLNNGAIYTVAGFTPEGNIKLDNNWIVSKDWGHVTHGWVGTSNSAQSRTVRRAIVVQSSLSFPASRPEQLYVSASRAKEQTIIFTDSKAELRAVVGQEAKRISATELMRRKPHGLMQRLKDRIALMRRLAYLEPRPEPSRSPERELTYERA